jgi:tetratricopeptide (TPR) repeat protein
MRIFPFQLIAAVAMALAMAGCDDPRDAVAYNDRGNAKMAKGDFDGAIADFDRAISLDPKNAYAYVGRGHVRQTKGDLEGAIADLSKAIELDPKDTDAYISRANAKQATGHLTAATADWSKAIEINPKDPAAYLSRASARHAIGYLIGAIADYTSAIDISPKDISLYESRGYSRYDMQDFAGALSDFRKVIELDPSNSKASKYSRIRIWLIRTRLGDEKGATQELLVDLADLKPGDPPDWPWSIFQYFVGHMSEPDLFASAKNNDPMKESAHMCEVYFYAGSRHMFSGENQMAIELFKKCLYYDHKDFTENDSALADWMHLRYRMGERD